jgi:hypothetical protein
MKNWETLRWTKTLVADMSDSRVEIIRAKRDSDLARLSNAARQFYDEELRAHTESARRATQALWQIDCERKPVSFREFVLDELYLGRALGRSMFPKLIDDGAELFDGEFCEAVFTGAIGTGKTTLGQAILAFDIYAVSCLRDPGLAFGMRPGANIGFVNVSVSKVQAQKVFFDGMRSMVAQSPYFNEIFPYDKTVKTELRFPKGLRCYAVAASEQAALGDNIWSACIDEANFMQVVERSRRQVSGEVGNYDQVLAVYKKLHRRLRSRLNLRGKLPGHVVVLSSARYPDDFTERLERQAREEAARGQHFVFFRRYALWDTVPSGKFMPEKFRVEVGDFARRSRVLTGNETDVNPSKVIEVPVDFKRDFERDADGCVRDFAGISVLAMRPFIARREMVQRMFELGEQAGLRHPFTALDVTLQQQDPDTERLLPKNLHWIEQPKLNQYGRPTIGSDGRPVKERVLFPALYQVHIDLSKTGDATGLVIAHNVGACKVRRFDASKMTDVEELKPVIRVDLVLRIVAPQQGEIDIPRIRAILYELNRRYKMEFGMITFDTWGSQESVKTMKDEGFNADILSVDDDTTPYETLRTAIYDERVLCYHVPVLERELIQLERGPKKIDHPPRGSKDIADGLAGAVQQCEDAWRAGESSRGLFQLGMVERAGEPSLSEQARRDIISEKIATGHKLTDQEEDDLLFGDLDKL